MTLLSYLAISLSATFTLLGLVHVYWALGGRRGLQAALPQLPVQPGLQRAVSRPNAMHSPLPPHQHWP
jgi:hypothetical protein